MSALPQASLTAGGVGATARAAQLTVDDPFGVLMVNGWDVDGVSISPGCRVARAICIRERVDHITFTVAVTVQYQLPA